MLNLKNKKMENQGSGRIFVRLNTPVANRHSKGWMFWLTLRIVNIGNKGGVKIPAPSLSPSQSFLHKDNNSLGFQFINFLN